MSTALLFPGQGAQHPGMLGVLDEDGAGRATLREVAGCLDDLVPGGLAALDSQAVLSGTVGAQLATLVVGVACGRAVVADLGPPLAVAGHSVGAFSAAVVAGVLDLDEAIRIVHLRAEEMERLFPTGYGMSAVTGLSPLSAQRLAGDLDPAGEDLWLANVNSDDQTVFAGCHEALDRLTPAAAAAGARAVHRLAVPVPSHGPPLAPVVDVLVSALSTVPERDHPLPCSSNVSGGLLRSSAAVREDLAELTARPVQWRDVMAILVESGADTLVQVRPGRVLAALAAGQHPDVGVMAVEDTPRRELAARFRERRRG